MMSAYPMKHCNKCSTSKPISEFTKKSSSRDGYCYQCKSCASAQRAINYPAKKERILASNAKSRENNRESILKGKKAWYEKVKTDPEWQAKQIAAREAAKEEKRVYDKAYCQENRGRKLAYALKWAAENPEKVSAAKRKWADANPESAVACQSRRRALKAASSGSYTRKDVTGLLEMQRGKCASCACKLKKSGKHRYHVDHVMPLAKGGSNGRENIQILCPPCNLKKSAKDPYLFAQSMGRLF
jgi:5-methylcytosine-specific restriction endonuclease McrA